MKTVGQTVLHKVGGSFRKIKTANIYQQRFSVDGVEYSAEGGERGTGGRPDGFTLPRHATLLTDCHLLELHVWCGPLCWKQLVACALETHLDQAVQAADLELESQQRKQPTPGSAPSHTGL